MANTGYDWGDWAPVPREDASDWTDITQADASGAQSDPISNDIKSSTRVGIKMVEDNTGAINGTVDIYILSEIAAGVYENYDTGTPVRLSVTPVQNDTVYMPFVVPGLNFHNFRVHVQNESGQELVTTLTFEQSSVPPATA